MILCRNFLRPQMLFHGERVIRAALHGGIVAHNHAIHTADAPDSGDDSGAGGAIRAVTVGVHGERGEGRQFQERRAFIQQHPHAVTRQQLAAPCVLGACRLAATECDFGDFGVQIVHQRPHGGGIGGEVGAAGIEFRFQNGHGGVSFIPYFIIQEDTQIYRVHCAMKGTNSANLF